MATRLELVGVVFGLPMLAVGIAGILAGAGHGFDSNVVAAVGLMGGGLVLALFGIWISAPYMRSSAADDEDCASQKKAKEASDE